MVFGFIWYHWYEGLKTRSSTLDWAFTGPCWVQTGDLSLLNTFIQSSSDHDSVSTSHSLSSSYITFLLLRCEWCFVCIIPVSLSNLYFVKYFDSTDLFIPSLCTFSIVSSCCSQLSLLMFFTSSFIDSVVDQEYMVHEIKDTSCWLPFEIRWVAGQSEQNEPKSFGPTTIYLSRRGFREETVPQNQTSNIKTRPDDSTLNQEH